MPDKYHMSDITFLKQKLKQQIKSARRSRRCEEKDSIFYGYSNL